MKIELRMYLNLINYLITSVLFWCITTNQIFPSLTFTVFKCISYLLFITALNTFNLVFGLIFIINNFRQLQLHISGNTSLHVGNLFKALHMTELENKLEKKKSTFCAFIFQQPIKPPNCINLIQLNTHSRYYLPGLLSYW